MGLTFALSLPLQVTLEKVLGITASGSRGLACDPHSGLVAYPAGYVFKLSPAWWGEGVGQGWGRAGQGQMWQAHNSLAIVSAGDGVLNSHLVWSSLICSGNLWIVGGLQLV